MTDIHDDFEQSKIVKIWLNPIKFINEFEENDMVFLGDLPF